MRKKVYLAAGDKSHFMGPGRPEFDPKNMAPYEDYLLESTKGTLSQLSVADFDEGVIGSFMSGRFIHQANLPGFLPFLVPSLLGKPCVAVEGACGTGGRAITTAARSILSDRADSVFVVAFEAQNQMKSIYGADVLAGAAYYRKMRKEGHAHFFPGLFDERAAAYFKKYGQERAREAMAVWYEMMIKNARSDPKAQEHFNKTEDLFALAMQPPNPKRFLPHLTPFDCSKVSDGAASIALFSEEGLKKFGLKKEECIELIAMGEAEGDITKEPEDPTRLSITESAVKKSLSESNLSIDQIDLFEIHDCFTITALLSIEALGLAKPGEAPDYILKHRGSFPINRTGGLIGFGHPTGASGVRQMVDLSKAEVKQAMMVSMGGDDKTVTSLIIKT